MGNCVSMTAEKEFLRSLPTDGFGLDDPNAFRVFMKKRSKILCGILKVTETEILLSRPQYEIQHWPLQFLRRYGYTSAGIFFFESGRRCPSGEGLHTFKSHQAESIFHLVQARIQDNANLNGALHDSRAQSVTGSIHSGHSSTSGCTPVHSRIHPVQRYCSEGTNNSGNTTGDYLLPSCLFYRNRFLYHRYPPLFPSRRPRSVNAPNASGSSIWPSSSQTVSFPYKSSRALSAECFDNASPGISQSSNRCYVNWDPLNTGSPRVMTGCAVAETQSCLEGSTGDEAYFACRHPVATIRSHSETDPLMNDTVINERYVNVHEKKRCPSTKQLMNRKGQSSLHLDYAAVNIGNGSNNAVYSIPSNCRRKGSLSGRGGALSTGFIPSVYARIDLERTKAIEVAVDNSRRSLIQDS
ncbi:hypothetical protein AB6A40_007311 [Gnathostoma spinigerum]|uniref:IRS-type PTB domain-containing protein n=1 Tax=Gnathostoma spinigerum TaxID=75299 RepID=A0ABD6EVK1_9BILA